MTRCSPILPPVALGVLGGGQLGGMFVAAAHTMGYRTAVLDPDTASPAARIANEHLCASYEDIKTLDSLIATCAAVTVEFENVPTVALEYLQERIPVSPSSEALAIAQNRIREKQFIRDTGILTAAFVSADAGDMESGFEHLSETCQPPYILKTARLGYDGKHQREVASPAEAEAAIADFGGHPCILEEKIDLACEVSVMAVRDHGGVTHCHPVTENEHRNGILHLSVAPARIDDAMDERVRAVAAAIAKALDYHGVLGVEFFIATDGRLLVNEIAPRPHNSGHNTISAELRPELCRYRSARRRASFVVAGGDGQSAR